MKDTLNEQVIANAQTFFTVAAQALNKVNPISICSHKEKDEHIFNCPSCWHIFEVREYGYPYCPQCGQKLNWA